MGDESKFCCLNVDITVRIIGMISLITYTLLFVTLVSDTNEAFQDKRVKIVLGFDSKLIALENEPDLNEKNSEQHLNNQPEHEDLPGWFLITWLVFSFTSAISSALLIWASITKQIWLAVPWLVCSVAYVTSQVISLVILTVNCLTEEYNWITAATVIHSVLIIYFFVFVVIAQIYWKAEKLNVSKYSDQEAWENVLDSPPMYRSSYRNKV